MKLLPVFVPFLSLIVPLWGGESTNPVPTAIAMETQITGSIADGKPGLSAPEPTRLDFKVKSTVVREMDVIEPPPMSGLPPIKGTITMTVHLVADPGLSDPPSPLPALPLDDPTVQARLAQMRGKYRWTRMVYISATVYDHARTCFRYRPSGEGSKEMVGWSNLDFNCFSGFATYQVKWTDGEIRQYTLMMGLGNENPRLRAALLAKHDMPYQAPEIPKLPDLAIGGPAFVITEGDADDREAMELIGGLHELYRVEGQRMEDAYQARIRAEEARRACLIAHPPVPKDVTVNFWERSHPVGMASGTIKPGGGN